MGRIWELSQTVRPLGSGGREHRLVTGAAGLKGQRIAQGRPGRDSELGEDPVQMPGDRPMRKAESQRYLLVAQSARRERRDLYLLRRQRVTVAVISARS